MKFSDAAKKVISALAPTLATALGGPLAGAATAQIIKGLGLSEEGLDAAITSADPQTIVRLREIEVEFLKFLEQNQIDLEKIHQQDRDSARLRHAQVKDHTPAVLAYGTSLAFFGALIFMLVNGVPDKGGEALLLMLGSLGTAWAGINAFYFGSSIGSKQKTELMTK